MDNEITEFFAQFRLRDQPIRPMIAPRGNKLFAVFSAHKGYIPLSCYAFGTDPNNAITRVKYALTVALAAAEKKAASSDARNQRHGADDVKRLESIRDGDFSALPCDERDILTAAPIWAMNSGNNI